MQTTGKILEALGLAAVMLALIRGFAGDMWGELWFSAGGAAVFLAGRFLEKRNKRSSSTK
ncbi:MAG TPA: hypothetical protein VMW43_04595 [Bacteroidota bacterium]|nr:hypothetical protein [Bacteroidota bacterium]